MAKKFDNSKMTDAQKKARIVTCLASVYKDFALLIDGEWVPDEDSCEASQSMLMEAVSLLRDTKGLPASADLIKSVNSLR